MLKSEIVVILKSDKDCRQLLKYSLKTAGACGSERSFSLKLDIQWILKLAISRYSLVVRYQN